MWPIDKKLLLTIIAILMLMLIGDGCSTVAIPSSGNSRTQTAPSGLPLLPGEQIWKNGVSSYLFGTNDTEEWEGSNVETTPSIQHYLKQGHFTLMRSFFFHISIRDQHEVTDQEIQQRINTITNSGMHCLGVIPDIKIETAPAAGNKYTDLEFAKHLVSLLDGTHPGYGECDMYEIGNEPDLTGDAMNYVSEWNTFVPALRALNPRAKFIGPASYKDNLDYIQWFLQGAQASGILPDAVTFHAYGCSNQTVPQCLKNAQNYGNTINGVRKTVVSTLHKNIPIGLTEWNFDPGTNSVLGSDDAFMKQFTEIAIHQFISAHLDFANQFDAMSYAGYGTLDMFNIIWWGPPKQSTPKAQYYAMTDLINQYRP